MARIAIFDSGVGGLSIYSEVKKQLAGHHYVFVSDNLNYPYGDKTEQFLIRRVLEVCQRIVKKYSPDLLVIACNSASTVVLPMLRNAFDLPIVGVVPAIKPASALSTSKQIALLATPGTIEREYTDELITKFAADCDVLKVGSIKLVELAERKMRLEEVGSAVIEREIQPILDKPKIDVIVLACTHFPLINKEISMVFKENNHDVVLLDSAKGIASRVDSLTSSIEKTNCFNDELYQSNYALFTKELSEGSNLIQQLKQLDLEYLGQL